MRPLHNLKVAASPDFSTLDKWQRSGRLKSCGISTFCLEVPWNFHGNSKHVFCHLVTIGMETALAASNQRWSGARRGRQGPSTKGVFTMLTPMGQFAPYGSDSFPHDSALLPRPPARDGVFLVAGRFV